MSKDKTIKAAAFHIYASTEMRYIPVADVKQIGDFTEFSVLYLKSGEEVAVSDCISYLTETCGFSLI